MIEPCLSFVLKSSLQTLTRSFDAAADGFNAFLSRCIVKQQHMDRSQLRAQPVLNCLVELYACPALAISHDR
jgi:hypothetical protein